MSPRDFANIVSQAPMTPDFHVKSISLTISDIATTLLLTQVTEVVKRWSVLQALNHPFSNSVITLL